MNKLAKINGPQSKNHKNYELTLNLFQLMTRAATVSFQNA